MKDLEVVVELSSGSHAAINGVETNYCDTHGEGKRERMEDDRTSKIDKIAEASIRDKLDDTVTEEKQIFQIRKTRKKKGKG